MPVNKCAVPSCLGMVEPVNHLGVCVRCLHPSTYYPEREAVFDELYPGAEEDLLQRHEKEF